MLDWIVKNMNNRHICWLMAIDQTLVFFALILMAISSPKSRSRGCRFRQVLEILPQFYLCFKVGSGMDNNEGTTLDEDATLTLAPHSWCQTIKHTSLTLSAEKEFAIVELLNPPPITFFLYFAKLTSGPKRAV